MTSVNRGEGEFKTLFVTGQTLKTPEGDYHGVYSFLGTYLLVKVLRKQTALGS